MMERVGVTKLDWADRWLRDGLEISRLPAVVQVVEIDMTRVVESIRLWRAQEQYVTFNHVVMRAAGMALTTHAHLHQMLAGNRRYFPATVRIGFSVASDLFFAPVLVTSDPDRKTAIEIAREMGERIPQLRADTEAFLNRLRRWGWLVPFSFCRQILLKLAARRFANRQRMSGTIQITSLPDSDIFIPLVFGSTAVLGVGRVTQRVLAVQGEAVVRPTLKLVCTSDHRVWDGRAGEAFLGAIKDILETGSYDQAKYEGEPGKSRCVA
jgi:pyruvate/2-oxoglutarate dehydrogenase complex dihydrolipoamide acyltransferase (E2) component